MQHPRAPGKGLQTTPKQLDPEISFGFYSLRLKETLSFPTRKPRITAAGWVTLPAAYRGRPLSWLSRRLGNNPRQMRDDELPKAELLLPHTRAAGSPGALLCRPPDELRQHPWVLRVHSKSSAFPTFCPLPLLPSPFYRKGIGARSPGGPLRCDEPGSLSAHQLTCHLPRHPPEAMGPHHQRANLPPAKALPPSIRAGDTPATCHWVHWLGRAAARPRCSGALGREEAGTGTCSGCASFLQFKVHSRHLKASFFPLQLSLAHEAANYRPAAAIRCSGHPCGSSSR